MGRHGLMLLGTCGLMGCASPPGPCGVDVPRVTLTAPDDLDTPLQDGGEMILVNGPQGGWHVEVGILVVNPDPDIVLDLTVDARDARVVDNRYELILRNHDGCTGGREGLFGFLAVQDLVDGDDDTPPELLAGEVLTVRAGIESWDGTAEHVVTQIGVP